MNSNNENNVLINEIIRIIELIESIGMHSNNENNGLINETN